MNGKIDNERHMKNVNFIQQTLTDDEIVLYIPLDDTNIATILGMISIMQEVIPNDNLIFIKSKTSNLLIEFAMKDDTKVEL